MLLSVYEGSADKSGEPLAGRNAEKLAALGGMELLFPSVI